MSVSVSRSRIRRKRAVADAVGAILLIFTIFLASMTIILAVGSYFTAKTSYNEFLQYESLIAGQKVHVLFAQALPSGGSGLVVMNAGVPVTLTYLVSEDQGNGLLSFQPLNLYINSNQTVIIPTNNPYSGVLTGLGGLFMANISAPNGMVPVSLVAVNASLNYHSGLFFVQEGTTLDLHTTNYGSVNWYINGTFYHPSADIHITLYGPTAISALEH